MQYSRRPEGPRKTPEGYKGTFTSKWIPERESTSSRGGRRPAPRTEQACNIHPFPKARGRLRGLTKARLPASGSRNVSKPPQGGRRPAPRTEQACNIHACPKARGRRLTRARLPASGSRNVSQPPQGWPAPRPQLLPTSGGGATVWGAGCCKALCIWLEAIVAGTCAGGVWQAAPRAQDPVGEARETLQRFGHFGVASLHAPLGQMIGPEFPKLETPNGKE